MINTFIPQEKEFKCTKDTHIGTFQVRKGDTLKVVERGDGLWNVLINGIKISFAIDGIFILDLAGEKRIEA